MTATDDQPTVSRNEAAHRYEIHVGDVVGGFTEFEADRKGRLVFPHTEVDPAFRGRGLATRLIAEAMADAATRGETVVPLCPTVRHYLQANEVPGLDVHWPIDRGDSSS